MQTSYHTCGVLRRSCSSQRQIQALVNHLNIKEKVTNCHDYSGFSSNASSICQDSHRIISLATDL